MLSELYNSVLEEEKKGLSESSLRTAAGKVAATYNQRALKKGLAYLDYNETQYRCAYLYKYAVVHTGLVTKFFRKLMKKKVVRNILVGKKDIKIACLGGGPGTDVVGIFKALSVFPFMHQRIKEASILDVCVGWHNTFNCIIHNLISGKVKDIPSTFVREDFRAYFLEVNLLETLSSEAREVIANADIICMVKFVSAVLGNKDSLKALRAVADVFKKGAIVLFIDNFKGNVSESIQAISKVTGLTTVMGPDTERFGMQSKTRKTTYGCDPLTGVLVTVMGLIKTSRLKSTTIFQPSNGNLESLNNEDSDDNWDTESDDSSSDKTYSSLVIENSTKNAVADYCDQFTQCDINEDHVNLGELCELADALTDLLAVMTKLKAKKPCCCNCDHH